MASGVLAGLDRTVLLSLAARPGTGYAIAMAGFTWLGDFVPRVAIALVVAAFLAMRGRWRDGAALILLLAIGMILVTLAKSAVARPRPDLLPHLDLVTSPSFPSAHAANNMMLWLGAALLLRPGRRAIAVLIAVPLLIGFSRVALGVHWPSDVIAGWAFGAGWVLLALALALALRPAFPSREKRLG